MKITLMQADIRWNDPAANRERLGRSIRESAPSDLIVLPEMFTTGFCTSPRGAAEPDGTETLRWMREQAAAKGAAIAGSVAVEEAGRYYNRFYFVRPDGTSAQYDKHHLFTYGGEHNEYTGGRERIVVEYGGWRIRPIVCYDLRFPVWIRNRGDYDLLLCAASWPSSRIGAWSALLRARAIENACYAAGVNRVGNDPYNAYCGASALYDFKGETLADGGAEGTEAVLYGEADPDALREFRRRFPVLDDADPFTLDKE